MFNKHILVFVISLKDGIVIAIWCFFSLSFASGNATLKFYAPKFWKKKIGWTSDSKFHSCNGALVGWVPNAIPDLGIVEKVNVAGTTTTNV